MLIGWRTLIAAAIMAMLGALQGLDWVTLVTNPKAFGWTAAGMAIIMAIFRTLTATPVTKPDAVASVDAMPQVKGVITQPTPEGRALAASIPSATVAPAGTAQATAVAS